MSTTPRLGLTLLAANQDQPEVPLNQALEILDTLAQLAVLDKDLTAPPGSPAAGATYIPASPASGAWVGLEDHIVFYLAGWQSIAPQFGFKAYVRDEDATYVYKNGSPAAWVAESGGGGGGGGSLSVANLGSPGDSVPGVQAIVFTGATVTDLGGNTVGVQIDQVAPAAAAVVEYQVALSDNVTALATGDGKAYLRALRAFTLTQVRASLLTASSSGAVQVDISVNGVSILSTPLTIDATEKTSLTAAIAAVIASANISDDDEIRFDIDGAGTAAAGLIVSLIGTP